MSDYDIAFREDLGRRRMFRPTRACFERHQRRLAREVAQFRREVAKRLSRRDLVAWASQDGMRLLARNATKHGAIAERGGDPRFGVWQDAPAVLFVGSETFNLEGVQVDV